mgnify:CR=1 FL=1
MTEFPMDGTAQGRDEDAALVSRVASALRAPEQFDEGFEARVMSAVRTEAAAAPAHGHANRGWWLRPRELRLSPLGALALAAGFAGMVSLGTFRATQGLRADAHAAAATVAMQEVRFVFVDPSARHVAVVGDFNGWNASTTPLVAAKVPGAWFVSVPLTAGRHEYAFIVDRRRWTADPLERTNTDEFDTESSVVTVGEIAR